jgi:cytochrome P450
MSWLERIEREVADWFTSPEALRAVSAELRGLAPIATLGSYAVVSRYDDVREVLANDKDFGVTEIYAARMERTTGAFFLGMEDTPRYRREVEIARRAVRADDANRIAELVGARARELLARAKERGGAFDAVAEYSRLIPLALVRDYLGVPGPDPETMKRWMRSIFWDLFLNQGDDAAIVEKANAASAEMRPYLDGLLRERKARLTEGAEVPDDFVTRLVQQQIADPGIDDDLLRRNIGGVIVGALDTLSKGIAHAIDALLRRPAAFESARRAAQAGDVRSLGSHVSEALRFNPHNIAIFRFCRARAVIADGTDRRTVIEPGTTVVVLTISAMFDPTRFARPDEFLTDRPSDDYLHFGQAQHMCFGTRINGIVLPLAVKELLLLDRLRYDEDGPGEIEYEGPFPDHMRLRFDVPR